MRIRYQPTILIAGLAWLAAGCGSTNPDPLPKYETYMAIRLAGAGTGAATGPAAVVGEGWGTLKGVFLFGGDPPPTKKLNTAGKDAHCDKFQIPDETLVVDPQTKGIKNIVIYARKVSRVHEDAARPAGEQVFDQKECVFLSHVLPVVTGAPVTIKNSDPVSHNTNLSPSGDASSNNLLPADSQAQFTFKRAQNEPVPVSCSIHPWMKSYIMPRKDTYVAVTQADGSFEIANLPAGEPVEFQVWHERQSKLAAKSEWSQGRFTVTIPKDAVNDLGQIQVSPALLQ